MKKNEITHKMKLGVVLLIGMLVFVGCQGEGESILPGSEKPKVEEKEKPEVFKSEEDDFEITATTKWEKDDTLHSQASLALVSKEFNSYLMVLKDQKAGLPVEMELTLYTNLISENLKSDLTEGEISEIKDIEVTGQNAKYFQVQGKDGETPITYLFVITEKEDTFYQTILWSSKENIDNNQVYYQEIINSFGFKEASSES